MRKFAIIAVGYNRVSCLRRLLNSLDKAIYPDDNVTLIISIDNSGNNSVENMASAFVWKYGEKKIVTYPERQGLRQHILKCGDMVKDYDAVVILEDDVIVSEGYYQFVCETYEKYHMDNQIAGISLYNYLWNENACLPFSPALSNYDVYFMQMSQSWGQVWTKEQWSDFRSWYNSNDYEFNCQKDIPNTVSNWPSSSWKKYHIKYCIEKNKFLVFPYKSLSSCYSDVGEHCKKQNAFLQVPLLNSLKKDYYLPSLNDDVIKYDAFFERILEEEIMEKYSYTEICLDLYGTRNNYMGKRYVISCNALPYRIVKTFGISLRPQEMNVIQSVNGNVLRMYDTDIVEKKIKLKNKVELFRYRYNLYDKTKIMFNCILEQVCENIHNKN